MLLCVEYVLRYYNHYHGAVWDRVLEQKTECKGNGGLFMQRAGEADWLEKEQNQ